MHMFHDTLVSFAERRVISMIIKSVNLETVCGITSKLPENEFSEFAFAGKSNVGKSSLINGLISRKAYARTSAEPGKTQTINYYKVEYREKSQKEIEAQGLDASYAPRSPHVPAWSQQKTELIPHLISCQVYFVSLLLLLKADFS